MKLVVHYKAYTNSYSADIDQYLTELGHPTPQHANASDHAISVVNTEFYDTAINQSNLSSSEHLNKIADAWVKAEDRYNANAGDDIIRSDAIVTPLRGSTMTMVDDVRKTWILTQRNFLNYIRNPLAYGIRCTPFSFPLPDRRLT